MYKVVNKEQIVEFDSLMKSLEYAKTLESFVTIQGPDFEVVGCFGVDSIKDGVCPDGVKYDWNKEGRIGRVKKERENESDEEDY